MEFPWKPVSERIMKIGLKSNAFFFQIQTLSFTAPATVNEKISKLESQVIILKNSKIVNI